MNHRTGHGPSHWRSLGLAAIVVTASAVLAAGCGDSGTDASSTIAKAKTGANGHPDFHGVTLHYLGFGGANDKAMRTAWFDPYEKLTGLKVVSDQPTDYKKLKIQQQSGNVQYDLVDGDAFIMDPGCGKDWQPLDVPNLKNVLPDYKPQSRCTAPDYVYQYVLGYSPKLNPAPQSCADFFDKAKFPGKRQAWSYYYGSIGECAASAGGADAKSPYPLDLDSVFDKIGSLKGDLDLYDTDNQAADSMVNDDATMGVYTTRMVYEANQQGAGWKVAPGWATVTNGTFGIPKGAPHADAAQALLDYILDEDNNKKFAEELPIYGSVVTRSVPQAETIEDQRLVSGGPAMADAATHVDWNWWAKNDPTFSQGWIGATSG